MRLSEKKHPSLVLSGGGVKAAAFHIGVCLALREKGFKFSGGFKNAGEDTDEVAPPKPPLTFQTYVGSSAGSVISTFLAAGYDVDAIIHAFTQGAGLESPIWRKKTSGAYLKPLSYRDIFSLNIRAGNPTRILPKMFRKKPIISGGLEVFLKRGVKVNGIFTTDNIERYLRDNVLLSNDFHALNAQLFIVATQLNHSRKVVFGAFEETKKDKTIKYADYAKISEAVAASASLPPVFSPYGITNRSGKEIYFFDGEIRDTLSTHVAADHGSDLVISSYSIQPYHFNEEMGSLHEYGMPMIANQALYQVVQQKIAKHIEHQQEVRGLINAVNGYLRQAEMPAEHREKLMEILISRTNYKPDVDYIYIHPSPQDYEMFFFDHFSLNPKVLSKIVRTGFKCAMATLRQYNI
ncbi:MAG: patatin-like phospholipase family protein [Bdellovibrionaceae bacterium]|nr:patatin-like phospholipase family protein [Bdellovibrionales bacterium]MCB9085484.1 patatin-like phospholipase family protein [Pseudobdellovibrionaceae bacterium]